MSILAIRSERRKETVNTLMSDPEGNRFPEGPDIKSFVIFLDFHFNVLQQQQKNTLKRSELKQYDSVLIRTQI